MNYEFLDTIAIIVLLLIAHLYEYIKSYKLKHRELNTLEFYIYQRDFSNFLSKEEFLQFFDLAEKKIIKSKMSLAVQNSKFDKLYYFALIPKFGSIVLKNNDNIFSYLREGAWIGIVEFTLNYLKNEDNEWLINLECESTDIVTLYEFDKNKLKKFLKYSSKNLQNSILKIWIKYLIMSVSRMNIHMAETYKESKRVIEKDSFGAAPTLALGNLLTYNL